MADLFTDRYVPTSLAEFMGNSDIVQRARAWAQEWSAGKKPKPLLLHGAPGVGKTTLALLLAKEMGWQLFEMNASDVRDKASIEKIAGGATANASLFGSMRLVLLDEIDGLQSQDRGGAAAVGAVIKEASNPIILTANDAYEKKLVSLRSAVEMLEFKKINYLSIAKRLREIAEKEGITFEDEAIKELARACNGDLRSALLDLQSLAPHLTLAQVKALSFRERKEKIFSVMTKVFKGKTIREIRDATDAADVSLDMIGLWVEENIPRQFDSADALGAFDVLSRADVFNGRIMLRQHYGFLKYSLFLSTAGVGLSRSKEYHSFQPFAFPSLLSSLSASSAKRETMKSLAGKIGEKMHCSRRDAQKDLPFLSLLFASERYASSLASLFGLEEKELALILGKKSDDKNVAATIKDAAALTKQLVIEKIHGKQATLFG